MSDIAKFKAYVDEMTTAEKLDILRDCAQLAQMVAQSLVEDSWGNPDSVRDQFNGHEEVAVRLLGLNGTQPDDRDDMDNPLQSVVIPLIATAMHLIPDVATEINYTLS